MIDFAVTSELMRAERAIIDEFDALARAKGLDCLHCKCSPHSNKMCECRCINYFPRLSEHD